MLLDNKKIEFYINYIYCTLKYYLSNNGSLRYALFVFLLFKYFELLDLRYNDDEFGSNTSSFIFVFMQLHKKQILVYNVLAIVEC